MLKGDLAATPLPEVLRSLADGAATGCLHVVDAADEKARIYLRRGHVYAVVAPGNRPQMGARLVSSGALGPEALAEALEAQRTELQGWRLGELLVHLGYVDQPVVERFVHEQICSSLSDLLRWQHATWRFRVNERTRDDIAPALEMDALLDEMAARRADMAAMDEVLHGPDAVPVLSAADTASDETEIEPDAWSLLCKVDGARSITELARECGFTLYEADRVVVTLVRAGLLEVEEPVEAPVQEPLPVSEEPLEPLPPREVAARLASALTGIGVPSQREEDARVLLAPPDDATVTGSINRVSESLSVLLGPATASDDVFGAPVHRPTTTPDSSVDPKRAERDRRAAVRRERDAEELARAQADLEAAKLAEQAHFEAVHGEDHVADVVDLDEVRAAAEALAVAEEERVEAEAARAEVERVEAEQVEAERAEAERFEADRAEAERAEAEAERAEQERLAAAAHLAEQQRLEAERVEAELLQAERLEGQRLAAEVAQLAEQQRLETQHIEAERIEAERLEAERLQQERLAAEAAHLAEQQRLEAERVQQERLAAEAAQFAEQERLAAEAAHLAEQQRLEAERLEQERLAAEAAHLAEQQRLEAERLQQERLAAEAAHLAEQQRLESERLESERLEAERLEAERLEAERLEAERVQQRLAADRAEAERFEAERRALARFEAEHAEQQRLAAEAEAARLAEEQRAAEAAAAAELAWLTADLGDQPSETPIVDHEVQAAAFAELSASAAYEAPAPVAGPLVPADELVVAPTPEEPPPFYVRHDTDTASLLRELSSLGLEDDPPPAPTRPVVPRPVSTVPAKKRKGLFGR